MRRKLTITFLALTTLIGLWQMSENVSAQGRLTLAMVLTGLQTKGRTPETATLANRNVFITKRIQTNGVTFRLTPEIERELRNAGATTALISAVRQYGPVVTSTPTPYNTKPSAAFKDLWVDYGVTENGQLGMKIHAKFTAYNMKGLPGYMAVYFLDQNSRTLKDNNGKFNSSTNDVAVYREITPAFDPAEYEDLTVFMPYSELDLDDGKWNLKMDVKLIYKAGGLIQDLTTKPFEYKQGDERDPARVTPKVIRKWVEYGVTEGGRKGLRLHVNFEVTGLKGVDSLLVARVQRANGDPLLNDSADYSNAEGHFQGSFSMKPGFDTTVYKDATIFIPYDEFTIGRGKHNLRLDIDLTYADGVTIKHLDIEEFVYTK